MREHPDKLVLGVVPGHRPSPLPPVRIFLGTEEGQYRAERVFVWSILQVRDPARVYEIHLMKNVAGFDRRGWRTGFTCYRFAIPDFAGRIVENRPDRIPVKAYPVQSADALLGQLGAVRLCQERTQVVDESMLYS